MATKKRQPTQDERIERYGSLATFVAGECCNYDAPRGRCWMLARECELLAPTVGKVTWRSPKSKNPHRVELPPPVEIVNP